MLRAGFLICLASFTLFKSTIATNILEVPDITAELDKHGVEVQKVAPLSANFHQIKQRYQEAPKGSPKLWLLDSSALTDEKKSTNEEEARRQTARLIPALADLVKDPLTEVWLLSGHPLSKLLGFYPDVSAKVNFAAEWGAHVRQNGAIVLAPEFYMKRLDELIAEALKAHEGKVFIKANLPGYQRMRLLKYDGTKTNVDDVETMLAQLSPKIQTEIDEKLTTNHNKGSSYFYFQYGGMGKGYFAEKLLSTRKPAHVITLGDSAQDESMHYLVKASEYSSDTVIKSSEDTQKTFAQHKVKDVPEAQKFLADMASP